MRRPLLARVLGTLVGGVVLGCREPPLAPRPRPPQPGPSFALVEDNGAGVGALLKEVTLEMPLTDAVLSGAVLLFAPGEVSGGVVLEVAGDITVGSHAVPVTELLEPGAVMWFHVNGDLFLRFASIAFFTVQGDGSQQFDPAEPSAPAMEVRFSDPDAAQHGLKLLWEFDPPQWSGRNRNDPQWGAVCPGIDNDITCFAADLSRVSETPPQGTVTVRVYRAAPRTLLATLDVTPKEGPPVLNPSCGSTPANFEVTATAAWSDGSSPAGLSVTLKSEYEGASAGHTHQPTDRPGFGQFDATSGQTDANGVFTAHYAPGIVGDIERLTAVVSGGGQRATATAEVRIRVPGLIELGAGPHFGLIGGLPEHPRNHFGTGFLIGNLSVLADTFVAAHGKNLEYNDMSLEAGGLFDLDANFTAVAGHVEHRCGQDVDLRTKLSSTDELDDIRFLVRRWLNGQVVDETVDEQGNPSESPHFHLRFARR